MGIFDKISKKIGDTIKDFSEKNATGETKRILEDEVIVENDEGLETPQISFSVEKADDLDAIIEKADIGDLWIGGYANFRQNQNAKFANMFSGINNLKFISFKDNQFYLAKIEKNIFSVYKIFNKSHVVDFKIVDKLIEKTVYIKLNDHTFTIDVTKNKELLKDLKDAIQ